MPSSMHLSKRDRRIHNRELYSIRVSDCVCECVCVAVSVIVIERRLCNGEIDG